MHGLQVRKYSKSQGKKLCHTIRVAKVTPWSKNVKKTSLGKVPIFEKKFLGKYSKSQKFIRGKTKKICQNCYPQNVPRGLKRPENIT